ncbi:hypothetical protein N431DRAFT_555454 [Stipitochalara longipes BDJ]|nr:hypothetical protein N431DRAFT_555454 [Stipitochalara longipes BDJ]
MAAQEYYLGSAPSPTFFPPAAQQYPPSRPQSYSDASPSSPPYFGAPSKLQYEPLVHEYNNSTPQQRGPLKNFPSFIYNWWLCILSVFASLCSIAAIVGVLAFVDGKPIPRLPLQITVNTYVSFFATIAKGTMLVAVNESISQLKWLWFREPRTLQDMQVFDDASRGPAGAMRLMFRTKSFLIVLGSLVAVLALVVDPFAQQIVSYPLRSVVVETAAVGRAQAYDAKLNLSSLETGLLLGPEFNMKAAIYDGLFKPGVVVDYVPQCNTGNCTFPRFDSLAVCSKCLDISQDITHVNVPSDLSTLSGIQNVTYGLPGGAEVGFTALFEKQQLLMGPEIVVTSEFSSAVSKQVLDLQDPLLSLAILQFPDVKEKMQDGNYFSTLPTTHLCALYFCVNTYEVKVENNNATTTVVSTWTSEYGTPTVGGALEPGGMDGTQDAVLQPPKDTVGENNNTYTIAAGTLANLQAWLIVTLSGSMNTSFSEVVAPVWADDEMVVLDQTTDWNFLMTALAKAMTTYIRDPVQSKAADLVYGTASRDETFVQVQWHWLTLPTALLGMSILFLGGTMLKNESKHALAWKSSSLALLFHGLEGVRKNTGEGMYQVREVARKTRVVLIQSHNGEWKLRNTGY